VRRCVEQAGIGFLFAPAFHPAMRHAAQTRSEMGIRTAFNILGPLANPARVKHQALGVGDQRLAVTMALVLHRLGHRRAIVFTGPDGIDELGLSGTALCHEVTPEGIRDFTLDPRDFDIAPAPLEALRGGEAAENAARIRTILDGEPGPGRDVVSLNAAAALVAAERAPDFAEGLEQARASIDSGSARRCLDHLVRVSQQAAAA
jgi:anthranilate phosphoribosyltransferase